MVYFDHEKEGVNIHAFCLLVQPVTKLLTYILTNVA